MRFVTPEVERIQLSNGDWIEVLKELTVGEEKKYRAAGLKNMRQGAKDKDGNAEQAIEIDWEEMAIARVKAYLVEWSATEQDNKGRTVQVPVTLDTIRALAPEDFDEIDKAIEAHIARQAEAKNEKTGDGK